MRIIERKDLRVGFVISYALPVDEPRLVDCLYVESLEEGEAGLTEIVYPRQIIRKEIGRHEELA